MLIYIICHIYCSDDTSLLVKLLCRTWMLNCSREQESEKDRRREDCCPGRGNNDKNSCPRFIACHKNAKSWECVAVVEYPSRFRSGQGCWMILLSSTQRKRQKLLPSTVAYPKHRTNGCRVGIFAKLAIQMKSRAVKTLLPIPLSRSLLREKLPNRTHSHQLYVICFAFQHSPLSFYTNITDPYKFI